MARKFDDFDEPEGDGVFDQILTIVGRHKKGFALASVSSAVILLGLIMWGTYPDSNQSAGDVSVPIVRADAGEFKSTPENPGGMEIRYRDSTIFASGQEGNSGPENILAEDTSEDPVPRSQLFAGLNTETPEAELEAIAPVAENRARGEVEEVQQQLAKVEPILNDPTLAPAKATSTEDLVKEAIGSQPDTKTLAAATNAESAKSVAIEKPAKVEPVVTAAATPKAAAPKVAAQPSASSLNGVEPAAGAAKAAKAVTPGGHYVQLASVREQSGAAGEFKKLQAKYTGLNGLQFRTQEANLGAKGTFYRIQAGPMSKESANDICNSIKKQTPGGCLVVAK